MNVYICVQDVDMDIYMDGYMYASSKRQASFLLYSTIHTVQEKKKNQETATKNKKQEQKIGTGRHMRK